MPVPLLIINLTLPSSFNRHKGNYPKQEHEMRRVIMKSKKEKDMIDWSESEGQRGREDRYEDTEDCLLGGGKDDKIRTGLPGWPRFCHDSSVLQGREGCVCVCVGRSPDVNLQWQGCCSNNAPPPMNQPTPNCLFPLCSSVCICRKTQKYSVVLWMTNTGKQNSNAIYWNLNYI